jgi:hypothetical protein
MLQLILKIFKNITFCSEKYVYLSKVPSINKDGNLKKMFLDKIIQN